MIKNQPATAEEIANFHREQGMGGSRTDALCPGDPVTLYKGLKDQGADKVRTLVDSLISRPGKPSWGGCV